MPPRVAIPIPHFLDREYALRALPQYERAVELAGGSPVGIGLETTEDETRNIIQSCDGVLLPGSKADVDPGKFKAKCSTDTAAADPQRESIDQLLLENAYARCKPVLGICYGLQSLNVFRKGSLIQHIPEFLPEATRAKVNHAAGKAVAVAHTVKVEANSRLAGIVKVSGETSSLPVNSSHHQSAGEIGEGLRIVARCPDDGIVEAIEGTAADHFVLAVQWHPERSIEEDTPSRAIFRAFIEACECR